MSTLQLAIETVRAAGALVARFYEQGVASIQVKSSAVDLVTEADLASQALVVEALRRHFPEYGVWAEEEPHARPSQETFWLLDPLDGTTNFAHRYPVFAVSLALYGQGAMQLAVTYDVPRACCYWAERGGGAWRDGQRLRVSAGDALPGSLLATGFPYSRATNPDNNLAEFGYFMPRCQGVRRAGSAALDLAWVAAGHLDGYWESHLHPWDCAAGVLLVTEAGGRVSDFADNPWVLGGQRLVASNGQPALHAALVAGLAQARQPLFDSIPAMER